MTEKTSVKENKNNKLILLKYLIYSANQTVQYTQLDI